MSAQHTIGPWAVAEGSTYCAIRTDARVIADMRLVGLHYNKADATLIAAAPDLLNALKVLADVSERKGIPCDAARAAIAKATGAT
jgi:hypothetical protein